MEGERQHVSYPNTSSLNDFWYFVGLVATDGCLLKDRRHISITSAEKEYLKLITRRFALKTKVTPKPNGRGQIGYHLQIGNAKLWRALLELGLTPKKSLTLGPLEVPKLFFHDFLRGVIDGDGSIRRWLHPQNGNEQWSLRIYSAAPLFSTWMFERIHLHFGVTGVLHIVKQKPPRHTMYQLKFGKMAARRILANCYTEHALVLPRKKLLAEQCVASYSGWTRSFTVKMQRPARVE